MGNRAVITTPEKKMGLYMHWNGGRDSVEPLLKYCEMQGYRSPDVDDYGWARLAQVVGNFFGGTLSVGIMPYSKDVLMDPGNNGIYVIEGWRIVERLTTDYSAKGKHLGMRHVRPEEEERNHDFDEMLEAFDAAMPPHLRLGEFLDSVEISREDVKVGDRIWMRDFEGPWRTYRVLGFGQPGSRRLGVDTVGEDGEPTTVYPDLPFVARYEHDGDYSWNAGNFVSDETVRIRPRAKATR